MTGNYILDADGNPQLEPDLFTWAAWFEDANRILARSEVGDNKVSTVFLGLDYGFGGGPPVLWETMVFPECDICERYSSKEAALKGHEAIIQKLKEEDKT
jgi:hypothetical protein